MNIALSPDDVAAIATGVANMLESRAADAAKLNGRLAYREAEAAALLGLPPHSLRDARLRGEIHAARVGTRLLYCRDDLVDLLQRKREQ